MLLKAVLGFNMANNLTTVLASVLISLVAGAGVAFVALPQVYPALQTNQTNTPDTDTDVDKGITQTILKSWQDESYILDSQLTWSQMNKTQVNFTISANSKILVQFSAPFLLYTDPTFSGGVSYLVSLVIENVGNTTVLIHYFDDSSAGNNHEEIYFPTLSFMTGALAAGTYNCSVFWRSEVDSTGYNSLSVSHHSMTSTYHYDRWMLLEEIVN